MPPKKKEEPKKHILLGRVGTNLKMGIVGLPNVGKSTFFNVMTNSTWPTKNFPFFTNDTYKHDVFVPDDRLDWLNNVYKPVYKVPAYLNVTDIAGLVKGAHAGEGLGNEFLSRIKECDGIFHIIRAFSNEEIVHVDGDVNPVRDIETIQEELILKDINSIKKATAYVNRRILRSVDPQLKFELDLLAKAESMLMNDRKPLRFGDWNDKEIESLNKYFFLTAKLMIYLINMSEHDYVRKKNKWLVPIKAWLDEHDQGAVAIPFSASYEHRLIERYNQLNTKDNAPSVRNKIIFSGYKALNLIYFYTVDNTKVKCWTIQTGTKAPQAAGKIHTDYEKGFIMAEIIKFTDLKELGNERALKKAGKYSTEGNNYVVEDGDIIYFKFNADAELTQS
ncbi:hypothetical protein GJ496_010018 [Pomphorhynchus laevis]|nr:hypothetical protein GJ496_010018 [Pomphorhynchus laevis]